MLNTVVIVIGVIVVLLIIVVATRPGGFKVERSVKIPAAPAAVFPHVNDLHKWQAWSPWENIDPALKRTYEGAPQGLGAIYRWEGNSKVGSGSMTVTESRPGELIRFRLEFLKPFKATHIAEFTFKPEGNQTVVTWTMTGKCNFVFKIFGLFISMDKMCGDQFEKGLAQLSTAATQASAA